MSEIPKRPVEGLPTPAEWSVDPAEALALLTDLIAIDSVNPSLVEGGAGERALAGYVVSYLRALGLPARLDEVAPGRPNAVGVLSSSFDPDPDSDPDRDPDPFSRHHGLILNGHLDTVTTAGMTIAPLTAVLDEDGDRVYGRGAVDMKGGLVMGLLALAALRRSGVELERSVLFTAVVDEEYASLGTEDSVRRYRADAAVVMEPTGLTVITAHKGFAWLTVETRGRAAHGSDYETGVDAIAHMGRVLTAVEALDRRFADTAADAAPGATHPLVGRRSLHASLVEGGRELSTYPDRCVARFERRTLPGEDPAAAAAELEAILLALRARDPSFAASVTLDFARRGYETAREGRIVETLAHAVARLTGRAVEYTGSSGWLDSALLGEAGIPAVIFGPDGDGAHAAAEWVSLQSIVTGAQILAATAADFCGRRVKG